MCFDGVLERKQNLLGANVTITSLSAVLELSQNFVRYLPSSSLALSGYIFFILPLSQRGELSKVKVNFTIDRRETIKSSY